MAVIFSVSYVHDPETQWVYVVGRVKPGVSLAAVQAKASTLLRQQFPEAVNGGQALARTNGCIESAGYQNEAVHVFRRNRIFDINKAELLECLA